MVIFHGVQSVRNHENLGILWGSRWGNLEKLVWCFDRMILSDVSPWSHYLFVFFFMGMGFFTDWTRKNMVIEWLFLTKGNCDWIRFNYGKHMKTCDLIWFDDVWWCWIGLNQFVVVVQWVCFDGKPWDENQLSWGFPWNEKGWLQTAVCFQQQ